MTTPFVPLLKLHLTQTCIAIIYLMILLLYQVFSVAKSFRALSVVKAAAAAVALWLLLLQCCCYHHHRLFYL
jgi:hypothetical protein